MLNLFQNHDLLERPASPADLLARRLSLENAEIKEESTGQGKRLHITAGVQFPLKIRDLTWKVLEELNGKTDTQVAVQHAAESAGVDPKDISPAVSEDLLNLIRFGWLRVEP